MSAEEIKSPQPALAETGAAPDSAPEAVPVPLPVSDEPMAETAAEIEELDTDAPRVGIVMGSKSDLPAMEKAEAELTERSIRSETRVMPAHGDPDTVADYARNARMRGLKVIIAGAGLAAALPGVVAAHTDLPVIGVPLTSRTSIAGGLDALLSIAQMPPRGSGGLRGRRQRAQRRGARRAHPQRLMRAPAHAPATLTRAPARPGWSRGEGSSIRQGPDRAPARPAGSGPGCTARSRLWSNAGAEAPCGARVGGTGSGSAWLPHSLATTGPLYDECRTIANVRRPSYNC